MPCTDETQQKKAPRGAAAGGGGLRRPRRAAAAEARTRRRRGSFESRGRRSASSLARVAGGSAGDAPGRGPPRSPLSAWRAAGSACAAAAAARSAMRALCLFVVVGQSAKKERRLINNQITVHVQQIAATRRQIEQKATDVAQFLHSIPNDPQRTFAYLSLLAPAVRQPGVEAEPVRVRAGGGERARSAVSTCLVFRPLLVALLHESLRLRRPRTTRSATAGTRRTPSTSS